jgi:hypothetical protein
MDKQTITKLKLNFDDIIRTTEDGLEYCHARQLQSLLGYTEWRNFLSVIDKAKIACRTTKGNIEDDFVDVNKIIDVGFTKKPIPDIVLTRYACYLIAQNGDSRKDEIAFAQSYFAVQTRKQEIIEKRLEELNRVQLREQLRTSEKRLSQNIYERGVDDSGFARIRSKGDCALFGGYSTREMKNLYGIKSGALADHLPPVTIAAKNLATEMTNLNVEQKDLLGENPICSEHIQNNQSVRGMLSSRGISPEKLPPEEDIKKIERRLKSDEKKLAKGK